MVEAEVDFYKTKEEEDGEEEEEDSFEERDQKPLGTQEETARNQETQTTANSSLSFVFLSLSFPAFSLKKEDEISQPEVFDKKTLETQTLYRSVARA